MKKILAAIIGAVFTVAMYGNDYPYLAISTTDGAEAVFKTKNLRFTIGESTLDVISQDGTTTFKVVDLKTMQFTKEASSIETILSLENCAVDVFTTSGVAVGHFESVQSAVGSLTQAGVYVFKTEKGSFKIAIGQ